MCVPVLVEKEVIAGTGLNGSATVIKGDPRGLDPGLSANSRAGRSMAVMIVDVSRIGRFWVRERRVTAGGCEFCGC